MIFERAARHEFAQTATGVFVALFAILLSTQMIRLLDRAAGGLLAPEAVAALLGFSALNFLPALLSLTLFMAILLPLTRAYRDSEMTVWFSSGAPLTFWLRPVLRFVFPIAAVIALLSIFLSPWAASQSIEYRNKLSARNDVSQITPGVFQEAGASKRIVFVEKLAEDMSYVKNVFVAATQDDRLGVTFATSGHQENRENGDRFLVLSDGRRYEVEPGSLEFRVMEFERYSLRLFDAEIKEDLDPPSRTKPIWKLMESGTPTDRGEILWRFGLPLSAILLSLLAVPLSSVNPRAGRSINMFFAILLFFLYNNLMSISQAWVSREQISWFAGFIVPHTLMLLVLSVLFYHRLTVSTLLSFWRRRDMKP